MNEQYAEAGVKRDKSTSSYLIKGAIIAGIILVVLVGTVFIGSLATFIATLLIVVCVYLFPKFNVEYEYVYCDGQLDFDKISGNAKRKTQLRIDFEKVDIVCPANSHSLDSYQHLNLVTKDFSSKKADRLVYAIVYKGEKGNDKILFEPSEKMLGCIRQKYPRKLVQV